jgi:hypothetical protein
MIIIGYSTGGHGRFLQYLVRCYVYGKILPMPFNNNGNSHNQINEDDICHAYDLLDKDMKINFINAVKVGKSQIITVYPDSNNDFLYQLKNTLDRVGNLTSSGIKLLEDNIVEYIKQTGAPLNWKQEFLQYYNIDIETQKVPRMVLRNYFLFLMYTYFNHGIWTSKNYLQNFSSSLKVKQLLEYNEIKSFLDNFFQKKIDFTEIHQLFLQKNNVLLTTEKEYQIIEAVENNVDLEITELDVVTEASILYRLEKKYFDIPFNLGNNFFTNTKEIKEYIDHFPAYLKKPNNIFQKYFKFYQR